MSQEIIKAVIQEVEDELFLGIPDETIDILISKILNSEEIHFDSGSGLKNDLSPIISNIANIVTIVAFIYGFRKTNPQTTITINIVVNKFPNISNSAKLIDLVGKFIAAIKKRI